MDRHALVTCHDAPVPDPTSSPATGPDVLANPAWASLAGAHAHLAQVRGRARRYPADVSPFAAVADVRDPAAWADLAALAGPGADVRVPGAEEVPAGWELVQRLPGVQMVATAALAAAPDPEAVELGEDDVDDALDLVARTRPGPFGRRTRLLGRYLGVRDASGRLVAMAGERMAPPGWTEVSAVCTDPSVRGRGYASRLVRAVAAGILERGDRPLLHASADNTSALRLYAALGFERSRAVPFHLLRAPS